MEGLGGQGEEWAAAGVAGHDRPQVSALPCEDEGTGIVSSLKGHSTSLRGARVLPDPVLVAVRVPTVGDSLSFSHGIYDEINE